MSIPQVERGGDSDGGWTVVLKGTPVAGCGPTPRAAVTDTIMALRLYAADWHDHLSTTPNHRGHADLVQMADACTDAQLSAWLMGAGR